MANISIVDTGYISVLLSGTQLEASHRANNGDEIEIKGVSFGLASGSNFDNSPTLNSFKQAVPNMGSIENNSISITGILNTEVETDRDLLYQLNRLTQTVGYKVCYYNSIAIDSEKQLVTMLSNNHAFTSTQQTEFGIDGAYNYINIAFTSFDISQSAGEDIIAWSLSGIQMPHND